MLSLANTSFGWVKIKNTKIIRFFFFKKNKRKGKERNNKRENKIKIGYGLDHGVTKII